MKNDSFFAKVQTALTKRDEEPTLSTQEQLRLAHLLVSGFSSIAAANVLIATRDLLRAAESARQAEKTERFADAISMTVSARYRIAGSV